MNKTIKKRIEEINSGIVPEGYEKTSFGIFPCDWIKVSLGEVSAKKGEYGLNAPACEYEEGLPKYLRITDIDDQGRYIDNKACVNDADSHKYVLNKGDIVFARTGASVGKNYTYDEKDGILVYAGFLIKFSIKPQYNANLICSNCRTKKYNNWVDKMCARSGQPGINAEEYATYSFIIPKSAQEQSRIAEILMQWDKAIELQEKLIEAYQKSKKYYLNKMFPKKGSNVPEIRFPGFTAPWEQRKLKQVATIQKGEQLSKAKLDSVGKYYVLNGGMEPSGFCDEYNTEPNTISISEGGNSCGYVALNLDRFWSGGHNYTLQNLRIDTEFLFQCLKGIETKIMALRVGSGLPNIQKAAIDGVDIIFPLEDEQKSIGQFLTKLSNLITLHQQKRDKLLKQRRALQQYLLTGIVRV